MLIIGASRGIGLAVAEHFNKSDINLFCISRSLSPYGKWLKADVLLKHETGHALSLLGLMRLETLLYMGGTWE